MRVSGIMQLRAEGGIIVEYLRLPVAVYDGCGSVAFVY